MTHFRLAAKGTDVLITSHGKPVAVLYGLVEEDLEDYVLSRHEGLRQSIEDADRDYQKRGGVPLAEALKQLKKEGKGRRGCGLAGYRRADLKKAT